MTGREPKAPEQMSEEERKHLDELLDEALEETFPGSDPVELTQPGHAEIEPQDDEPQDNQAQDEQAQDEQAPDDRADHTGGAGRKPSGS